MVFEFVWLETHGCQSEIGVDAPVSFGHELAGDVPFAREQPVQNMEDEVVLEAGYVALLGITGCHERCDHRTEFFGNLDFAIPQITPGVDHEVIAYEPSRMANGLRQDAHRVDFRVDE